MKKYEGIGASNGVAIAKAYVLKAPVFNFDNNKIKPTEVEETITKIKQAFDKSSEQLRELRTIALKNLGEEIAVVFDGHINIVNDPMLFDQISQEVKEHLANAPTAVSKIYDQTKAMFEGIEDAYLKERASDIGDVKKRILSNLLNVALPDLLAINHEVIIIADDLTPSETSLLNKQYVKGFATNIGGRTSHSAIMARTLEIPAVLSLKTITETLKHDQLICIDGNKGVVYSDLSEADITSLKQDQQRYNESQAKLKKYLPPKAVTLDGHETIVAVNIGKPIDLLKGNDYGAKGVGLFRTEFLYMDSANWPDEETQFNAYKQALDYANNETVIIRTLDIGGDKKLNYYQFPEEMNPFLGFRAIRFTNQNPDIFKAQLRALLRAAKFGSLGIMFPMIANLEELFKAKEILEEAKKELDQRKVEYGKPLVGIMIEIPSAAVMSDVLAKYVDFFSIGTNDMIQYSFAVDRMSKDVNYLYQPLNPALLRIVKMTIDGGLKHNVWTGMCGEMAGEPLAIPILLGMGLKEFSMSASSMLKAKELINNLKYSDCKELVNQVINLESQEEVVKKVKEFLAKNNLSVA
ncbi:phosphoenolpyruvate-protein kinase [Mycoplasmoides gallisepticum NC08_2008.031-4-3P]|uniref:Phosphoenolpyruvate-protein phosphotransferase n=1 Tax=Mycoplasmoides gallisepticum WI01_2001.043-13-2P TaxID=1159201 RepID=J3YGK0_MYCGL|nr:phosphoenolpyruvate--protein phosphotransferase [Mycoplasmoides gallisepticum]AFP75718.1 phosphoenolpyruvate-protein kinase [Mycoplasmoides gallisepticum VA94_7994-1-7P]AFP76485.1 phosphoenolpyruvate-protein kinase [Mycoplasmoides gallisepticum NC95_13295-2-2P]AFP77239.1 phosphoenolpyruvate-protein kinase [Mycoplasmoides gallisepticum NC96_1596-4-2P]AFP78010.1 phosphoenolpyruvate-protein kinase [Mycoplasmoides gallisepticum NY01_2001.047-5-1P]AFP78770.1 phosphoenolpyruvate-protein kinase [M